MCPMNPRLLRPLARFQAPAGDPFATLVSTKSTANVAGTARSTTGYITVEWWDATTNVYGTGVAGNNISWSKAAGGAGSKTVLIYPSDASGNLDGSLTALSCYSNSLTSLDVSGLTALTSLSCYTNSLTSLDASGLTALTALYCYGNSLTSLDVSGCTALTNLTCNNNSLTSLDVSGLTALTALYCYGNSLTSLDVSGCTALNELDCNSNSLTSLDASGLTALAYMNCYTNSLTSLDVSGCTALTALNCSWNSLTSLRAQNVGLSGGNYYSSSSASYAANLRDNQLGAAALDQFYTDLAAGSSPLLVFSNPGTTGDDPSIATNKGYTVYGS
jgi:hypothetical protein